MTDKNEYTLRKAFTETLLELALKDKNIIVITSDATGSTTLDDFKKALPEQFVETGIAEQNAVGVAGGMGLNGKKLFVCSPGPFLSTRALEQIKLDVAYNEANVKLIAISSGISYGALGYSHHAIHDLAVTRALVGLNVLVPCDAPQMRALTRILLCDEKPAYIRIGRGPVPDVYSEGKAFCEIGKAPTLHEGRDIAILAIGEMVAPALDAAKLLAEKGIHARVHDMFSLKPMDIGAVINAAQDCKLILTVEEHGPYGGLGGAVSEVVATHYPVKMKIMALPDTPLINGESEQVLSYYKLNAKGIASGALELLEKESV